MTRRAVNGSPASATVGGVIDGVRQARRRRAQRAEPDGHGGAMVASLTGRLISD